MKLTGRVWFLLLICLQFDIFKFRNERFVFAFAQNITTNRDSLCSQGITLDLCQILPKQMFMDKCINNGDFDSSALWKGNTFGLLVPQAVFYTLTNEKGIYHGGKLYLRDFYRFQLTVYKSNAQLHGYTFAKQFYLQPSDITLFRDFTCDLWNNTSNLDEVYEINNRDIAIFFCFNLPWTCIFILLIYFNVFGKVQWTTLQYKRYRGYIWSRRKVY